MDPYPSNGRLHPAVKELIDEVAARAIAFGSIIIPFMVLL